MVQYIQPSLYYSSGQLNLLYPPLTIKINKLDQILEQAQFIGDYYLYLQGLFRPFPKMAKQTACLSWYLSQKLQQSFLLSFLKILIHAYKCQHLQIYDSGQQNL